MQVVWAGLCWFNVCIVCLIRVYKHVQSQIGRYILKRNIKFKAVLIEYHSQEWSKTPLYKMYRPICLCNGNLASMGSAPYHLLARCTSLTPERETLIHVFDWLSYTRKIWNTVRLKKALYAESAYTHKDVHIHFFCEETLNAKTSLWLLLHTAHPACATNA